jgi:hypothetical protein
MTESVEASAEIEFIEMQHFSCDCAMCGGVTQDGYAVRWYEEPVPEDFPDAGYASVCKACHDKWAKDMTERLR